MANPFSKFWNYLMALFSSKIDEHADPKVQIQQAIEDAQRQHAALSQQAAAVIGNQRQLEMKLNRQMSEVERLQASARQALVLADEAKAKGDATKSQQYEETAQVFATQLVSAEQQMEDLKAMHDQALQAAEQAKQAVEQNAMAAADRSWPSGPSCCPSSTRQRCRSRSPRRCNQMSAIAAPGNTPTLDEVRDKIERRYANALGAAELSKNSVQGRMLEVEKSTLDMAGAARLDQLRAQMHPELSAHPTARDRQRHQYGRPDQRRLGRAACRTDQPAGLMPPAGPPLGPPGARGPGSPGRSSGGASGGRGGGPGGPWGGPSWLGGALPQVMRAAGQGADLVSQVTVTAAEVMRSRREPSAVAERRRLAARRRLTGWSVTSLLLAALGTYGSINVFSGGGDAADIAALVLIVGLLVWCVLGAVRAGIDLRIRTRIVRRLPAPQPRRSAVASAIRPQIDRLSDYSDSLRELIGMVGIAEGDPGVREVRDQTLAAADEAENALRSRAAELTALLRMARTTGDRASVAPACSALTAEITVGVEQYGRLVVATGQAAAASRQLAGSTPRVDQLADATDRLTALAAAMRELAGPTPR